MANLPAGLKEDTFDNYGRKDYKMP